MTFRQWYAFTGLLVILLLAASQFFGPIDWERAHAVHSVSAATNTPRQFHVSGQAIPAVAAAPTPIEGTALTTDVNVDFMVIANTDTSAHTVTVVDCTAGTPFSLFTAYSVAASTMWPVPLGNTRFRGCLKWSASSTTVMGTIVGTR